uniref:Uncharacterized protein n=1 Tax=viral metagenome TaxID=1070528 RepID=A0A6H2A4M0_9ZZZZ
MDEKRIRPVERCGNCRKRQERFCEEIGEFVPKKERRDGENPARECGCFKKK